MSGQPNWDAAIVGGGHNALVAATLLARAGWRVAVFERLERLGGAVASAQLFPGVDARVSRYSYLVSLFPSTLRRELGLDLELRARPASPAAGTAWHARMARMAERLAPTLTEPLLTREQFRARLDDDRVWEDIFEAPLGDALTREFPDDAQRGEVLTDGLIGTFASATDPSLVQNRCFLLHVIGDGTGDWKVPVGGMGALAGALEQAARAAGAQLYTNAPVTRIATDGRTAELELADGRCHTARHVLCGAAPAVLAELLGGDGPPERPPAPPPEGSQLKLNMIVSRLPRLADGTSERAFAGTFHVNEGYAQLELAHRQAAAGAIPELPPCELYCHSLADRTILGPELAATGAQTLTLFALHMPARVFAVAHEQAKRDAVAATLRSLNRVLAEPIEGCLLRRPDGKPCLEALTPLELQTELAMPGGHIFHGDLQWPFAETAAQAGRWGVETELANVWLCGAGARRGGGVSGIAGHNAARAVLASGR